MWGVSASELYNQSTGAMSFLPRRPNMSMPTGPKLPATVDHVKKLLFLASTKRRWYIIVVFSGGTVTPLGLLQELHMRSTLIRIPIYLSGESKDGHGPHVSCCPFCMYTIQNDPAYLNHIVCVHYEVSFACAACLSAITSSGQQMKAHIKECSRLAPPPMASQESVPSGHSPKKRTPGSKHVSSKKRGSHSEKSQPAGQASQDSQTSDRCVTHATGASQETTAESTGRRTRHKRKKAKTHKEKKSSK